MFNINLYVEIIFWTMLAIVFYTYIGYGILLWLLIKIKRIFLSIDSDNTGNYLPHVTILIAAYNEEDVIANKIRNLNNINYPKEKLQILFVTDGSTDKTVDIIKQNENIDIEHIDSRNGKTAAINRAMKFVKHDLVVFNDANAMINSDSIRYLVQHFQNKKVGCVAGEKRVLSETSDKASAAGEGIYWQYESKLKKWDSELNSTVGAAGELFAIRKSLFNEVSNSIILDDFIISMSIAAKGYKIAYEPNAFALESASTNIFEEAKRKIRISAGGIQSIIKLNYLLNPFNYGILCFQYISHRVLRWTIAPIFLILLIITNVILVEEIGEIYTTMLSLQILFYLLAITGYLFEKNKTRVKAAFIPFYFVFMNYCLLRGMFIFFNGRQSAVWEKAERIQT